MISIRKRGQVYQYSFEISKVDGKRKRKSKSGFKTKKEAMEAGIIEYNNYFNNGCNTRDEKISYSDYLDLWIEDYKQNMKYNTVRTYKSIIEKYLKPNLGQYRLSGITSYQFTENYYISSTEETRKKANEFLEKTIQSEVIKKIINFEEFLQKD